MMIARYRRLLSPAGFVVFLAVVGGPFDCPVSISANEGPAAFSPDAAVHLIQTRCATCHNGRKARGGLVLESREGLLAGGDNGPAVRVGAPDASPLIGRIRDGSMPPVNDAPALSAEEVRLLTQWVTDGAPWPATSRTDRPFSADTGSMAVSSAPAPMASPRRVGRSTSVPKCHRVFRSTARVRRHPAGTIFGHASER